MVLAAARSGGHGAATHLLALLRLRPGLDDDDTIGQNLIPVTTLSLRISC